jgi:hypothetical protein
MKLSTDEITAELEKQNVNEKYIEEGVPIIQNYMQRNQRTLDDAIKFLIRWISIIEKAE